MKYYILCFLVFSTGVNSCTSFVEHSQADSGTPLPTPLVSISTANANSIGYGENQLSEGLVSQFSYLSGKTCQTIFGGGDDNIFAVKMCRGVAEYKIRFDDGEALYAINLISPKGIEHDIGFNRFASRKTYKFLKVDNKLEWLLKKQEQKLVPVAVIVRYNGGNSDEIISEKRSYFEIASEQPLYLMIVKITSSESCVVDIIKAVDDPGVKVKQIANTALSKPCLEPR